MEISKGRFERKECLKGRNVKGMFNKEKREMKGVCS